MNRSNTCESCGERVVRAKRGEKPDVWISLEYHPSRSTRARGGAQPLRVLDGRLAFRPDHMAERLGVRRTPAQSYARGSRRDDALDEFQWHAEHKCSGV